MAVCPHNCVRKYSLLVKTKPNNSSTPNPWRLPLHVFSWSQCTRKMWKGGRGDCEVHGWDENTFLLFHKLNIWGFYIHATHIGVFEEESGLFHFCSSLNGSLRNSFWKVLSYVSTNTFRKEGRAKLAHLTPLGAGACRRGLVAAASWFPSLPGKFAPRAALRQE